MAKRMLAWVLSLILAVSLLPVGAQGAGVPDGEDTPPVTTQAPSEETPEESNQPVEPAEETQEVETLSSSGVSGDFAYTILDSGAVITEYTGPGGVVEIPAQVEGSPVVSIGNYVFQENTQITAVTMPDSVTSIGSYTFQKCTALEEVTFSQGLLSVGNYAFFGCTALTAAALPDSLTTLGSNVFTDCTALSSVNYPKSLSKASGGCFSGCAALTKIEVPEGVTVLPADVFRGADGLEQIILPSTLTEIENSAFYGCSALKQVTVPKGVTEIGTYAFYQCKALTGVELSEGLLNIGSAAFQKCSALTEVSLPDSVTAVDNSAFADCTALSKVNYPKGLASAGNNIFSGCTALTKIEVPEGVTVLAANIFRNAQGLKQVTLPSTLTEIGNYAFYSCAALEQIVIPEGVTKIGDYAFYQCKSMAALELPEGLLSIERSAFEGCAALTAVELPDSLTSLGSNIFAKCTSLSSINYPIGLDSMSSAGSWLKGCTALKEITVPEGVTALPDYVFYQCDKLEQIHLPSTLTSIGKNAFEECSALKNIVIPDKITKLNSNTFQKCSSLTSVTLPDGMIELGNNAFSICTALTQVELPDSITTLGSSAFQHCIALETINYPKALTTVGSNGVFQGCTALRKVVVPEGVTALPAYLYRSSPALEEITLPSTLTSIGKYTFSGCSALRKIEIPLNVTEIDDYAFNECIVLAQISLPEGLTRLGDYAFQYCEMLEELTLPGGLESIGNHTFRGCIGLKRVYTAAGLTQIGSSAFENCISLETVELQEGLTSIGNSAFSNCTQLTAVRLPDSVTNLGSYVFENCTALSDVNYPKSLTTVGSNGIFKGCGALKEMTVPDGITALPNYVFRNSPALEKVILPETLTSIGVSAFDGCTALKDINLPAGVTIGADAFRGCVFSGTCGAGVSWSLDLTQWVLTISGAGDMAFDGQDVPWAGFRHYIKHVSFDAPVTSIPDRAFAGCGQLTSVVLPEKAETVGSEAFADCTNLKRVEIPEKVQSIGDSAFDGCTNMDTVIFCGEPPQMGKDTLPAQGSYKAYYPKSATGWSDQVVSQYPNAQWSVWDDTLPVRDIVLLLDVSGSMSGSKIAALKTAVNTFADKVGGRLTNTRIAVISYATDAVVEMPLSTDVEWLHERVNDMSANGSTYYLKALDAAERLLSESDSSVKSIILFSDGAPTDLESAILSQAADMRKDYYIYTVGLAPSEANRELLIDIAGTQQNYFEADDIDALVELFVSISDNIGEENMTEVTMTRDGQKVNVLTEEQTFRWSSSEVVDLEVTPYWADSVPGTIRITQRGETIAENTTGIFSSIVPGTWFNPLESIYVVLVDADGNIAAMVKTKINIAVPEDNRLDMDTSNMVLTIYEAKQVQESEELSYILSSDATVTTKEGRFKTGDSGQLVIPAVTEGSITVEKEGFITRTITAQQLENSKKIYLQRVADYPVLSAVWLGDVDVLTQSRAMALLWEEQVTLQAEVSWGNSGSGTLSLVQGDKRVAFSGDTLTTTLGDTFELSETVYIEAVGSEGQTARRALKFEGGRVSDVPDWLDGLSLSLGTSYADATLSDGVEPDFMKGTKIMAGITTIIPVTASVDKDGKVYIAIGIETGSADIKNDGKGWDVKNFVQKLKNTGVFDTSKLESNWNKFKNLKQTYQSLLKQVKGSMGFSADFVVMGYAEGYWTEEDGITLLDGGLILNPYVKADYNLPFFLGPVPLFFEASFIGDIKGTLNLNLDEVSKALYAGGQVNGSLSISAGVGAGAKNVLYAAGGITGSLKPNLEWNYKRPTEFTLTASLNAYAKGGFVCFEYKYNWPPVYEEVWYPAQPKSLSLNGFYDQSNYTRKDLSYLDSGSQFTGNTADAVSTLGADSLPVTAQTLKTNIYRESTPQYLHFADGTALSVWLDGADSGINSTQLYYAYYDGASWSSPAPVYADGTMDYAPQLKLINGTAWLVWQNATMAFDENAGLEQVSPNFDIAAASFTKGSGFGAPATFQRDNLDTLPVLAGDADDTVYVAWVNNSANDWFGSGENSILCSAYTNGAWSEIQAAYTGLNAVNALAADGNGGLQLAWCQESGDSAVLYENGRPVTEANGTAYNPVYVGHTLYWAEESGINWKKNKAEPSLAGVSRFQLLSGNGEWAALYTTSDGLYSTLNLSYYNDELGQWCEPVALTDGTGFIGAYSGTMLEDGTVEVLINHQQVTGDMENTDPYGTSRLELLTLAPRCDLTMSELVYSPDAYNAGSDMELFFELTNNGSQTVRSAVIKVTDEKGGELSSIIMDDVLAPGQTITTSTYFTVPADGAGQMVTVTVTPEDLSDSNPSDNSQTAALSFEDVAVEDASWGELADGGIAILANVVNYGYSSRANLTVELREGSPTGPVLAQTTVAALEPLALDSVSFALDKAASYVYYITIRDSGDQLTANDSDFAALSGDGIVEQFAVVESVTSDKAALTLNNDQAGTCIVAVYDENGRMLTAGTAQVKANAGAMEISYPAFNTDTGRTVKVFLVDGEQNPLYPSVEKKLR